MATIGQVGGVAQASTQSARRSGRLTRAAGYLAMLVVVALIGLPLAWLLSAAFKETSEIYIVPSTWIPRDPTIQNFPSAWNAAPFGQYYVNTIVVTVVSVVGKLIMATGTAYALVMLRFPAKTFFFALIL